MRTTGTYQHTHMYQQLLQGILLERSWPHGIGTKMQVLIDSRSAGSLLPSFALEAIPGSCIGATDGLIVGEDETIDA
jgi:hypothetical protein